MDRTTQYMKCEEFFEELTKILEDGYELLSSCNQDISAYLCPNGSTDEVTYTSKPENSFRISDHWNWYSNVKKCKKEGYIQCFSRDLPYAKKRLGAGKASRPISATCVCIFTNGEYRVVFGEKFDRKNKTWDWIETSPKEVILKYLLTK